MDPLAVAAILVALVAGSTVAGLLWRRSQGRVASASAPSLGIPGVERGAITLVQFSSPVCAYCGPARVLLGEIAGSRDFVRHIELDVVDHPELASRLGILQTPTTLIVDASGDVRSRIGGAPRRADLVASIDRLAAESGARSPDRTSADLESAA